MHGSVTNLFNVRQPIDLQIYGGGELAHNGSFDQEGAVGRSFTVGLTYKF
jgi:outer membrane receptor protein involved in Fe transport